MLVWLIGGVCVEDLDRLEQRLASADDLLEGALLRIRLLEQAIDRAHIDGLPNAQSIAALSTLHDVYRVLATFRSFLASDYESARSKCGAPGDGVTRTFRRRRRAPDDQQGSKG